MVFDVELALEVPHRIRRDVRIRHRRVDDVLHAPFVLIASTMILPDEPSTSRDPISVVKKTKEGSAASRAAFADAASPHVNGPHLTPRAFKASALFALRVVA